MMRFKIALSLVAAAALAACSSSDEPESEAAGGDGITAEEARAAMESIEGPRAGQYKSSIELIDFHMPDMPDMPKGVMGQVGKMMSQQMETTYCQTEQNAKKSAREMTDRIGQGDCSYNAFEVSGNSIKADMTCTGEGGMKGNYKLSGTVGTNGSDMMMEMDQHIPQMAGDGNMHMKARIVSERIGDCEG